MLLQDKDGCHMFRTFLKNMRSAETINFWIEIEIFRNIPDSAVADEKAQFIVNKYFDAGSASEINIDGKLRAAVMKGVAASEIHKDMFDQVQQEVFDLLCQDCFMNFTKTPEYASYRKRLQSGSLRKKALTSFLKSHLSSHSNTSAHLGTRLRSESQRNFELYFDHVAHPPR